jgi:hypothetical protein
VAFFLAMDTVEKLNQFQRFDDQTRLFPRLADHRVEQPLAQFEQAAGQRPVAFERLGSTPHQKHPALVHNHRAHAHQRRKRKLSLHTPPRSRNFYHRASALPGRNDPPTLHAPSPSA